MPLISKEKKERISEQILEYLFSISPGAEFTSRISKEIARDEEFTKKLLGNLSKKGILTKIKKNKEGVNYSRRDRWRLSEKTYQIYRKHQHNNL